LQEQGHDPKVVLYLEDPPTVSQLTEICFLMKISPRALVRSKEKRFKELALELSESTPDSQWYTVLVENPILIERPIIVNGDRAVIGRPPERILEIL
jgi:arsenate reductase